MTFTRLNVTVNGSTTIVTTLDDFCRNDVVQAVQETGYYVVTGHTVHEDGEHVTIAQEFYATIA